MSDWMIGFLAGLNYCWPSIIENDYIESGYNDGYDMLISNYFAANK